MADKDSTTITDATTMADGDTLGGVQSGNSRDFPGSVIKAYTSDSPTLVTPNLGTPSAGVATNLTGTAAGLTAGTCITIPTLTGDVSSSGNAITIANNAVETAMINAGVVTTAKIADNAITLAKMAGGTDGELITYDANGDPANVATGTSGQVLTSNGAGAAPTFQSRAARKRCRATLASDDTGVDASSGYAIPFDAETRDEGGWHDNVTNNTRFSVPSGVSEIDMFCHVQVGLQTPNEYTSVFARLNGTTFIAGGYIDTSDTGGDVQVSVPGYPVTGGTDYIEFVLFTETDTSVTINSARTQAVVAETVTTV